LSEGVRGGELGVRERERTWSERAATKKVG